MASLLAVDLGLRAGLAVYGDDGRLRWFRSVHFGNMTRFKRAVPSILESIPDLVLLVVEGDRHLADVWSKAGERVGVDMRAVNPETWRTAMMFPREMRTGALAKEHADALARRIIDWSTVRRPTSLRHDAAEAILIGMWGVMEMGWLTGEVPWRGR